MRAITPKNGTHCQPCGNPLLLPAVVVLLTNDCRQIEFHIWRTGLRIWAEPLAEAGACVCVSQCWRVAPIRQGRCCWERIMGLGRSSELIAGGNGNQLSGLVFMISVGVIPAQNECLYTRQWSSWTVELSVELLRFGTMVAHKPPCCFFVCTGSDPHAVSVWVILVHCCSSCPLSSLKFSVFEWGSEMVKRAIQL